MQPKKVFYKRLIYIINLEEQSRNLYKILNSQKILLKTKRNYPYNKITKAYGRLRWAGRPFLWVVLTDHTERDDQQVNQVVLLSARFRGDVSLVQHTPQVLDLPFLEVLSCESTRGKDVTLLTLAIWFFDILL